MVHDVDMGPAISITANDGRSGAELTLRADGLPELRLNDQRARTGLKLGVDRDGKCDVQKFERGDNP